MPWFVVQSERKTWTRYLVQAENENEALQSSDNWQYLGYIDGDDTESNITGGPFDTAVLALGDITSYTDN